MDGDPIDFLKRLLDAAVRRADPRGCVPLPLPPEPEGRTVVVGAGKASAAFAEALEQTMTALGREIDEGFVICPYGSAASDGKIARFEASHPVPDQASLEGAKRILDLAQGLGEQDELIVLLSGGGSSLMALPIEGVTLKDKIAITNQLLKCGAPIQDINCVRKHLSQIKGGKLARAAAPARVTTLAISDVVGNDPAVIASGPTSDDTTTSGDAETILARYDLTVPQSIRAALASPQSVIKARGERTFHLIATPEEALDEAARTACELGAANLQIHNLGCSLEGDAARVAKSHAALAQDLKRQGGFHLLLSGGELTCHLPASLDFDSHPGGPNHVYILSLLKALEGEPGIHALAADTDGKDGSTSAAGAFIGPDDWQRAQVCEITPAEALASHRSGVLFAALGNQLVTGPTHTNVNDFRAILIVESNADEKA